MQRYFAATLGFGFVAVWTSVGLGAALSCALASGACYGFTVLAQRRMLGRVLGSVSPPSQRRVRGGSLSAWPERRNSVALSTRPVERKDLRSDALIPASDYGW